MPADQLSNALVTGHDGDLDPHHSWSQVDTEFNDWNTAAGTTAAHLRPLLDVHTGGWWFIRKHPHWRIRYRPAADCADHRIHTALDRLLADQRLHAWHATIYEPETLAFGGPAGMAVAHDLFCGDSPTALALLTTTSAGSATHGMLGRAEVSVLAISRMLRAAGLDWFEQGDVWSRVADLRHDPADPPHTAPLAAAAAIHRLLTLDTSAASPLIRNGPLTPHTTWLASFDDTGTRLTALARTGQLHRGLRAVLAHHIVFHWNRLALPRRRQLALAALARDNLLPTDHETP